jgi:hypothetical protein
VSSGHQAALFNEGLGLDTLSQSFATTPGAVYNVTFDLASERGGPSGPTIDFLASAAGTTVDFATPIGTPFVTESFSFTATAGTTTLQFASYGQNGGNAYSPILDNVDVEVANATPEPSSIALLASGFVAFGGFYFVRRRNTAVITSLRDA